MRFVKTYNDFKLDCKLELKPGTITALIGRNGSGKTTLFKLYLGLIEDDDKHTNQVNKEEIGVVWNDSSFSLVLNVLEIKKILMYSYKHFDCDYFDSMISRFELDPKKPLKEYSTGMLSKLKIIIATSLHAKILLLDEPTSGLDVIARNEVLDLLRDYMEQNEEVSILISSHIASDLEGLCDEFYFIEKGEIILQEQDLESYALLKGVDETVDLSYASKKIGSTYLTNERQFYVENYPNLVIEKAHIDRVGMTYLYSAGDNYVFMNTETYEQVEIPAKTLEDQVKYLKENLDIQIEYYNGEIIGITLPEKIEYEVVETTEAVKGNTTNNAMKDATIETGYVVKVPLFIAQGEKIIISTKDGKYSGRA